MFFKSFFPLSKIIDTHLNLEVHQRTERRINVNHLILSLQRDCNFNVTPTPPQQISTVILSLTVIAHY